MSIYTSPLGDVQGKISCNATDCGATVTAIASSSFAAYDEVSKRAKSAGWSAYASRTVRHYCPQHGPRSGHRMRVIW